MASILKNPTSRANLPKHGHDVSKTRKFSATVGQLLPMYYDLLYPGDKVYISDEILTRTKDLDAAAMTVITQHIDYFFVPFEQIYSVFGSVITNIDDLHSSMFVSSRMQTRIPFVGIDAAYREVVGYLLPPEAWGTDQQGASLIDTVAYHTYKDNNYCDDMGVPFIQNYFRLFQLFGFSDLLHEDVVKNKENIDLSLSFSAALPAVYQKIYYDYYRLGDRESNNQGAYSLDRYYDNPEISEGFTSMMTLHYRPMKKDFFSSVQVSPLFGYQGTSSLAQSTINYVNQWLTGHGSYLLKNAGAEVDTPSVNQPGYTGLPSRSIESVNVPNLTTMFALNKMLEVTRRAGKHYDKQMLAHFGVDVPTGISGEVMYLGTHSSSIQIGDVVSTATTENSYLGQVGGKGYGYGKSDERIEFTAPAHGFLMAIYSAVPEIEYQPTGVDRLNTMINNYDFYQPEFDKLGMQPLFVYQSNVVDASDKNVPYNRVLGWQYRYSESKLKYDDVTGAFTTSLDYWTTSKRGQLDNYLTNYQINPSYLDKIMLVKFLPGENEIVSITDPYARDPLFGMIRFDVKKVNVMSTYGLIPL